jgi:GH15 family glucan-1,4-alpha-glucosidase
MDTAPAAGPAHRTEPAYRPIEDYGLIGDMYTVAPVGKNGSIDWCCLPRFDAPSVFTRILDADTGGFFQIRQRGDALPTRQFYWPDTNVLVTRFLSADGVGEVRDFMPVAGRAGDVDRRQIVRTVRAVRGTVTFDVECRRALDCGRAEHQLARTERGVCFRGTDQALSLATEVPLRPEDRGVVGAVTLQEGDSTTLLLRDIAPDAPCAPVLNAEEADRAFRDTVQYWRDWLSQCTYTGRWQEQVRRSALTLKLLTYEPIDALSLHDKYGVPISDETWQSVRRFANWVCEHWRVPDEWIGEVRGGRQQFVYPKLMCWVAVDRALRLSRKRSLPAPEPKWQTCRDAIYETIMEKDWNEDRGGFTQTFGGDTLDASTLTIPLVRFLSPGDRRMLHTLDATLKSPDQGGLGSNGFVYRYNVENTDEGLEGDEGTFNICTFWLVEALTRGRPGAAGAARRGATDLRADARLRQPPWAVRRGDGHARRGAGQFPPGLHAPVPHQRRLQPRPRAG